MKQKTLLLVILLSLMQFGKAQTVDVPWALGLNVGVTKYTGDLGGNALTDFTHSEYNLGYWNGGLTLATYLNPSFDLGILADYGLYGIRYNSLKDFKLTKFEGSLFGHYKFNNGYILPKTCKISPFLSLGLGFASYGNVDQATNNGDPTGADFIVPLGVGVKYQISDHVAIQYLYQYNITSRDNHDRVVSGGNDVYGEHLVSVIFGLGKLKDTDKDGVADKYDLCPNTPAGVKVDAKGCPIDTDNDGVADYLDKCPNTPSNVKVDANGCPLDTDGDGVPDYLDKCPDTPAGVAVDVNGCPLDADKDGVPDYLDKCPNTPACSPVDANGCPLDRDGDGVPDYLDKCPDVAGTVANNGCPEVAKKVIVQELKGIKFETNKDVIKKVSKPILNKAIEFMKANPSYNLEIDGYTDNQGKAFYNLKLSQKRANSVAKYLVDHGIDAKRLSESGFGESVPVSDNKTEEGRAQNRRVDFQVK
jgi:outer membrane protein OmpA-like peptidoglycan-associated protein